MTSSSNNAITVGMEGHSITRPPLFDGLNYQFWNNCMSIFMWSYDYEMWDVVMDDPYVPMKKIRNEESEPKLRREWTEVKLKKVQVNFKTINTLHCALNPIELIGF